ncbi:biopolymer transporter ExbD [bacterium]|nr:biopolymer transporter ExbD [bacterium]
MRTSRKHRYVFDLDPINMTPMMNLMVVLIPLLLTSAEFVRLGIIELNLPPAVSGAGAAAAEEAGMKAGKLDLAVTITDRGFFISSAMAVLANEGEPTLPVLNGMHDFSGLSMKLLEIKRQAKDLYPDLEQIIILAEPEIDYQTVVSTMDAARSIEVEGNTEILFPEVFLSATVR